MKFRRCAVCGLPLAGQRAMHPSCEDNAFADSVINSHEDNHVQRAAAQAALPNSGTQKRAIYDLIISAESHGRTYGELEAMSGIHYNSVGPRVRDLKGYKGQPILVKYAGRDRPGTSGRRVDRMIWIGVQFQ